MVVGILESHLHGIVIHITDGKLVPHPIQSEGLELKVSHGSCGILREGLVHSDINSGTRNEFPADEMRLQYLICDSKAHINLQSGYLYVKYHFFALICNILYILEEFGYAVCNRNMALVVVMQSVQSVFLAVFRLLRINGELFIKIQNRHTMPA